MYCGRKVGDHARRHARAQVRTTTVVACGALALMLTACSSSGTSAAPPTTHESASTAAPSESAVEAGINFTILPSDQTAAATVPPPAGFVACTAAGLTDPAKAAVAKVNNGSNVPANVAVWVLQAAVVCNRPYVLAAAVADMTIGDGAIPGVTATQATCASSRGVDAVVAMSPDSVGSATGGTSPVNQALAEALDACYPVDGFIDSQFRQGDPGVTADQLACIHAKLGASTWAFNPGQPGCLQEPAPERCDRVRSRLNDTHRHTALRAQPGPGPGGWWVLGSCSRHDAPQTRTSPPGRPASQVHAALHAAAHAPARPDQATQCHPRHPAALPRTIPSRHPPRRRHVLPVAARSGLG